MSEDAFHGGGGGDSAVAAMDEDDEQGGGFGFILIWDTDINNAIILKHRNSMHIYLLS